MFPNDRAHYGVASRSAAGPVFGLARSCWSTRFTTWRWFWDYGGGSLTDLYSHWVDVIHWFMNSSDIETAQAVGRKAVRTDWECPDTVSAAFIYKPGFQTTFDGFMTGSLDGGGLVFRGTKALLRLNRDGLLAVSGRRYREGIDTLP